MPGARPRSPLRRRVYPRCGQNALMSQASRAFAAVIGALDD